MRIALLLALAAGLTFVAGDAAADPPKNKGPAYQEPGFCMHGFRRVIASADTTRTIIRDGTPNSPYSEPSPACFRTGSLVVLHEEDGDIAAAWVMSSTVTFAGATNSDQGCSLTDGGTTGEGACFSPTGRSDQVPRFSTKLISKPGGRTKICDRSVQDMSEGRSYPFCSVDNDCTDAGAASGTSCEDIDFSSVDTTTFRRAREESCLQLVTQSDAANAVLAGCTEE